jgi:hypothetical protein
MSEEREIAREAAKLENQLQKLADQWRAKIADPLVKEQIEKGTLELNPLLIQLLKAFPPVSPSSTSD